MEYRSQPLFTFIVIPAKAGIQCKTTHRSIKGLSPLSSIEVPNFLPVEDIYQPGGIIRRCVI
jgi:hypothetical protein